MRAIPGETDADRGAQPSSGEVDEPVDDEARELPAPLDRVAAVASRTARLSRVAAKVDALAEAPGDDDSDDPAATRSRPRPT